MEMQFLGDSSAISSAGFQGGYLCVEFTDGSIYSYESVPVGTWRAFKASVSKGFFFNKYIRNSYSFMEGMPPDTNELKYIDAKYFDSLEGEA